MEESNKGSFKQKVIESRGKEVPMDYFLYSCLEHERTAQAVRGDDVDETGWPVLASYIADTSSDTEFASMPLAGLLTRLCAWYRDTYEALTEIRVIDYESLLEVVEPLVRLNKDISLLYKTRTGEDLPDYEGSVGNNKFWDDIISTVGEYFRNHAHLYVRYIQWSHAAIEEEDFIPGDRPPVGRFAPRYSSSRPPSDGPRGGGRPERGGRDGRSGGRGNDRRPPRGDARPPRGDRNDRGDRGGDRGDRGPRRDKRGGEGRKHREDVDAKLMDEAMAEVDRAIESLRSDESMDEVLLKPQNSFYRRIQHQKIVDSGYHSFSVGEGPDRAVRVARRPS